MHVNLVAGYSTVHVAGYSTGTGHSTATCSRLQQRTCSRLQHRLQHRLHVAGYSTGYSAVAGYNFYLHLKCALYRVNLVFLKKNSLLKK
eukprot:SAG31_NODE_3739_length_3932_cov_3.343245_1_plen_89_part_00